MGKFYKMTPYPPKKRKRKERWTGRLLDYLNSFCGSAGLREPFKGREDLKNLE